MKSSREDLMKRGYADEVMIKAAECLKPQDLLKQCSSENAWERSAAVYALKQPDKYVDIYVDMLSREKRLYTKIACCEVLAKGNEETIKCLISKLGRIGDNQHHCVGKTSMKKSYPLPRDIMARIIARMDGKLFPMLFDDEVFKDPLKLSEALDAIGFMVFYNQHLVDMKWASKIMKLLDNSDPLICWKAITALSAFPLPAVRDRLMDMLMENDRKLLHSEIRRSLNLINERMKS